MKVLYHGDPDGKCAGFWVKNFVRPKDNYPVEFLRMDYNTQFDLSTVKPQEQVIIVDYSLDVEVMRELFEITDDIIWIDHHKTSMDKYEGFERPIKGLRVDGIAGCVLTFIYLGIMTNGGENEPTPFSERYVSVVPMFTRLIGDRDVWDWKFGDKTRNFFEGLQSFDHEPQSPIWLELSLTDDTTFVEERGLVVSDFKTQMNKRLLRDFAYETEFMGHKAIACNTTQQGSELFDVMKDTYPLKIVYNHNKDVFTISMYSDTIDVSEIAVSLGGGGHKGAAGFSAKTLPFKPKEVKDGNISC